MKVVGEILELVATSALFFEDSESRRQEVYGDSDLRTMYVKALETCAFVRKIVRTITCCIDTTKTGP